MLLNPRTQFLSLRCGPQLDQSPPPYLEIDPFRLPTVTCSEQFRPSSQPEKGSARIAQYLRYTTLYFDIRTPALLLPLNLQALYQGRQPDEESSSL